MILTQIILAYINLNILVGIGFISLVLYPKLAGLLKRSISARSLLKLHYTTLSILFVFLLLYPVIPVTKTFEPASRILMVRSMDAFTSEYFSPESESNIKFPVLLSKESDGQNNTVVLFAGFLFLLFIVGTINIFNDLRKLFIVQKGSYLIRKYGAVSIYANDIIKIPFSYWLPGKANVIIPTELLGNRADYKIIILHELQHHRNGDTKWLYLVRILKLICFLNPCIHLWCRLITEFQEFACDEVMVSQKGIRSQDYARCLFEAAKSSSNQRWVPVCATGLILIGQRKLLKKRIEKIFEKIPVQLKWPVNLFVLLLIIGQMTSVSIASKCVVQSGKITSAQASEMAERAMLNSKFPIVVNDLVLDELNAYLGTPEARTFISDSLKRMKYFKKDIEAKMVEYDVPIALLAIPVVESGYRNLSEATTKSKGAGLWMFIPSTARNFGLTVNKDVDERLDTDILTDAAMRYLLANKLQFDDWQLAVLAYNMGKSNLRKAIEKTGSRSVWDIIRAGHQNDKGYYAKFMAAVIIMKNLDFLIDKTNF